MAWAWEPAALPGVITAALILVVGATVFAARPAGRQNRLVLVMTIASAASVGGFFGARRWVTDPGHAYGFAILDWMAVIVFAASYLLFLGTLGGSLARPLGTRIGTQAVVAAGVALVGWLVLVPSAWVGQVVPEDVFQGWDTNDGSVGRAASLAFVLVFVYGLSAMFVSLRASEDEGVRRRRLLFLMAFAAHDGLLVAWIVYAELLDTAGLGPVAGGYVYSLGPPLAQALFVGLAALAVTRYQVLDFERRLQRILQATLLAIVGAAATIALAAGVGRLVTPFWAGLALSAALVGAILVGAPAVRRIAGRAAVRLVPVRQDEQLERRRIEIYGAALDEAFDVDGTIGARRGCFVVCVRRLP